MAEQNIKKLKYENKCSVPGCKTVKEKGDSAILFSIPSRVRSTPENRNEWLELFKLKVSNFPSIFKVCEKHFEERDILKPLDNDSWAKLLPLAKPKLFLPNESTPIEEFDLYDNGEGEDSSSDDYPQSRESIENEFLSIPIETTENQTEEFHDAIEKVGEFLISEVNEKKPLVENLDKKPLDMEVAEDEEKVYHDLKPHITGDDKISPMEIENLISGPENTNIATDVKPSEEKVLKIVKRVAQQSNPVLDDGEEESPAKRPRRNVIHKLIKPRNVPEPQEESETPIKGGPLRKLAPKPQQVIVKKVVRNTPVKVIKKVDKTPAKPVIKTSPKVEKAKLSPKVTAKPIISPKVTTTPSKPLTKTPATAKRLVVVKTPPKPTAKVDKKEPEPEANGAAASRSRRNIVHKLIKPRVETPIKEKLTSVKQNITSPVKEKVTTLKPQAEAAIKAKPTTIVKVVSPAVVKSVARPTKVEIYSSSPKTEESTPTKDDKSSPKIVMISSKLIQGSPKFIKTPQILKMSPKILCTLKTSPIPTKSSPSPIIITPKKPVTVLPKVAVKRLTSKVVPLEDDARPRRNVPHKFIKTVNNGSADKEKKVLASPQPHQPPAPQEKKVTPLVTTPQKLDPVETMHLALLKEFLSDTKSVQLELVKKKATSIARIIGLKSFKVSDDWTKKFIARNLSTCNGGGSNN